MKELNWGGSKIPLIFHKSVSVYKSRAVFVVNNKIWKKNLIGAFQIQELSILKATNNITTTFQKLALHTILQVDKEWVK